MKKILVLLTAALITAGCGDSRKVAEASITAEEFISYYTSGDFNRAASLCSEMIMERIDAAAVILSPLDSNAKAAAVNTASDLKWEKEVIEDEDDSVVTLRYSSIFNEKHVTITFRLAQSETGDWTIIRME